MSGTLTNEQHAILLACRTELPPGRIQQLSEVIPHITEWEKFAEMIRLNGVSAIFFHSISRAGLKNCIPEPVRSVLQQSYYANITRNTWVELELHRILEHLHSLGVSVIPLKGILLGKFIFGNTALRQSNDIDLLVDRANGQFVWDTLKTLGYKRTSVAHDHWHEEHWEDFAKHFPALNNGKINVEVHQSLFPAVPEINQIMANAWEQAVEVDFNGLRVMLLSLEYQFVFLSYHLDTHVDIGQFQLRLYVDLAEIAGRFRDKINWELLLELADKTRSRDKVLMNLYLVSRFFEIELSATVTKALEHLKMDKAMYAARFEAQLLTGKSEENSAFVLGSLVSKVVKMKGFSNRIKFISGRIFPSKAFMVQRYRLRYPSLYFLWYFRRLSEGLLRIGQSLNKSRK